MELDEEFSGFRPHCRTGSYPCFFFVLFPSPEVLDEAMDPLINSDEATGYTHAEENSARLALRRSTAFWTCHSQTSETRLSTQLPQDFPSFLVAGQVPRSLAYPMTEMDASDSGVTARMFVVG